MKNVTVLFAERVRAAHYINEGKTILRVENVGTSTSPDVSRRGPERWKLARSTGEGAQDPEIIRATSSGGVARRLSS
jgi:hypothetical protein